MVVTYARPGRRPAQTGLNPIWWASYILGALVLAIVLIANVVGLLEGPRFGPYLAGLFGLLLFTTSVFVRMVLAPFAALGGSVPDGR